MSHPKIAELVLEGVIADPAMKQVVLGDLAEEWNERAESDGVHAANWWYCLHVIRAIPHFLLEWLRGTRWYAIVGIVFLGLILRVVTTAIGSVAMLTTIGLLGEFDVDRAITTVVWSLGMAAATFLGGAAAARVSRTAPMPAVLWLTFVVFFSTVAMNIPQQLAWMYPWYMVLQKLLEIPAAFAGGLYVMNKRRVAV